MKKLSILFVLFFYLISFASADTLDELLQMKRNPVEAYKQGKALGCSAVIVQTVYDAYDWWFDKGRKAALQDIEVSYLEHTFEFYKDGLAAAEASSERYSLVVNARYAELYAQACERGFKDGYEKVSELTNL